MEAAGMWMPGYRPPAGRVIFNQQSIVLQTKVQPKAKLKGA